MTSNFNYAPLVDDCSSKTIMDNGLTPVENGHVTGNKIGHGLLPVNNMLTSSKDGLDEVEKGKEPDSTAVPANTADRMKEHYHDTDTQTPNASVITIPKLRIPGETGELAGLGDESGDDVDSPEVMTVTPEKLKKVYMQIKAKKIKYKLIFFASVMSLLLISYSSAVFPWFIPYYHTVVFPFLYILRVIMYTKSNWQLYCLDFCYFANIALLIYCWAFPRSEILFAIVFGATAGPVAIAVFIFRNSLVFHDYDRLTSSYIHLVPNLAVYLIRWFPKETSVNWYFNKVGGHEFSDIPMYTNQTEQVTDYLPTWVDARWLWVVVVPLLWFVIHTISYMVLENCCFLNKKYLTSFKWLTGNEKSIIYSILTLCGTIVNKSKVKISWIMFCILYGIISFLLARLCYEFFIANTIYLILLHAVAIYNGASFYIDVFAKRGLGAAND